VTGPATGGPPVFRSAIKRALSAVGRRWRAARLRIRLLPGTARNWLVGLRRSAGLARIRALPGATTAELGEEPRLKNGELVVELSISGIVAEIFDPSTVREDVVGARPAAAEATLQLRLDLAVEPQITIEPPWLPWRWLTRGGDHISIRFAGPSAADDSSVMETSSP